MTLAPIALFCYKRTRHLERVLEALAQNTLARESTLYIFSDGPKDSDEDRARVATVRQLLDGITGFAAIHIYRSAANQGLATALIAGISQVLTQGDRVIVLEDDILVNQYFLEYMNEALELYRDEERVGMVCGHIERLRGLPSVFFARHSGCWGWGTWRRSWNKVNFDGAALLAEIRKQQREREFDLGGAYPYMEMLQNQIQGRNNSWAIRVYASFFLQGLLTLYPGKAMSVHIGYDGMGTHVQNRAWNPGDGRLWPSKVEVLKIAVKENLPALRKIGALQRRLYGHTFWGYLKRLPLRVVRKFR